MKRRLAIGCILIVAVVCTPLVSSAATKTCLTGTDPSVASDAAQIGAVRALVDAACLCSSFDGSKGKTHGAYVKCAADIIKAQAALPPGALRPQCKRTVKKFYKGSTCGKDPNLHAQACIKRTTKTGALSCSIKATTKTDGSTPDLKCVSSPAGAVVGCRPGLPYTHCIEAADTNGNLRIDPDDTGTCSGAIGPWAVGHRQLASVDASRANRSLPLEVWYPVDAGADTGALEKYTLVKIGQFTLSLNSSQAHKDAAVSNAGPRPLIVFSHGSGGIAIQSVPLMERLASYGFVVVAPSHTGNTSADVTAGTAVPIVQALLDRVPDISFVITHMTTLAGTPLSPFFGRIDGLNVGVAGHSLGGFTALAVKSGYQGIPPDARVKAIMPIAPAASSITDLELANVTVPTLFMTGTLDGLLAEEARDASLIQSSQIYRADVVGATHTHFANICDIANALIANSLTENLWPSIGAAALVAPYHATCIPPAFPIEEATRLQNLYATAFFRHHLLGETSYDHYLTPGYAASYEPAIVFVTGP